MNDCLLCASHGWLFATRYVIGVAGPVEYAFRCPCPQSAHKRISPSVPTWSDHYLDDGFELKDFGGISIRAAILAFTRPEDSKSPEPP